MKNQNNLKSKVCSRKIRIPQEDITYKMVKEIAKKYTTQKSFIRQNHSLYKWAYNNNKLEEIFSHLTKVKKEKDKNERKEILAIAKKYKEMNVFMKENVKLYKRAYYLGMIPELSKFLTLKRKKYTLNELSKIAKKYKTRKEWIEADKKSYDVAKSRKVIDKVGKHFISLLNAHKYSKEMAKKEALKYSSREEFRYNSRALYYFAYRENYLDEVCSHMENKRNLTETFDQEILKKSLEKIKGIKIKKEYRIKGTGIIDFLIELPSKKEVGLEVKSDSRYWSKKEIKKQVLKYNNGLKGENYLGTTVVSVEGTYGLSQKEMNSLIKELIKKPRKVASAY